MTQKELMLKGFAHIALDDELLGERMAAKKLVSGFNALEPDAQSEMEAILRQLFGKVGSCPHVEQPLRCDYGYNTEVGDFFYANYNLVILDIAKVKIGNNVLLGPNVGLYTVGHPIHVEPRNEGYEFGREIVIGDNVWIGGHVCVLPGARIGSNSVIGAGSVVSKDIPQNSVAAGNPCKVIRQITEADKDFFREKLLFHPERV